MKSQSSEKYSFLYPGIILIMIGLYSALTYVTPLYIDDWMFMSNWKEHAGTSEFSFRGWWNYYEFTRSYDNGRIANALAVFTSLFSPWKEMFPLLNGVMAALLAVLCQRIVCVTANFNKTLWLCIAWFMCLVFVPWTPLFVADYSLNYIWGATINLLFLYVVLTGERQGWAPGRLVLAMLLGIIAGGWHESLSIETICGLIPVIMLRGRSLTRNFYYVVSIYILSTFFFGFSEGMRSRFGWEFFSNLELPNKRVLMVWVFGLLCFVGISLNKKIRKIYWSNFKSPVALCCMGVILSGYCIGILTRNEPRAFFWPNIGFVILLMYTFAHTELFSRKIGRKCAAALIAVLPLFCIVQLVCSIVIQDRYKILWNDIYGRLSVSETGIVYYDTGKFEGEIPRLLLIRPVGTELTIGWQNQALQMFFRTPFLSILPEQLKHMDNNKGYSVSGNTGAKIIDGFLIGDYSPPVTGESVALPYEINLEIRLNNGEIVKEKALASPFLYTGKGMETDTLTYMSYEVRGR